MSNCRRALALLLVLLLTFPALPAPACASNSAIVHGPKDFVNGTSDGATPTSQGLRLDRDETLVGNWTRMDGWPAPRYHHALAYDSASGLSVLFGGFDGTSYFNDTWTFDAAANTWTRKSPAASPPARQFPSMACDRSSGDVVLFGGDNGTSAFNDTWTYDAGNESWQKLSPAQAPPARWAKSYELVCADGLLVLFGGQNQTWIYSGGEWTKRTTEPTPPGRQYHSMAYDSARGLMVLFGGGVGHAVNDTWTYNVSANLWTNLTPAVSPRARYGHGMAYDRSGGKVVLFSGYDEYGLIINDTWTFDAGKLEWTEMAPASFPYPRSHYGLAYDESAAETVLFSGSSLGWTSDDTWSYNLTANAWTRRTPAPSERLSPSFCYDTSADVAVLFGGNDYNFHFSDTWTYDYRNNRWKDMRPAGAPSARKGSSLVYDGRNGLTVLFGGEQGPGEVLGDTWTYNATSNSWVDRKPAVSPPARAFQAMAYDPVNAVAVLFGGKGASGVMNDTWHYDLANNTWTQLHPAVSPPARQEHAMAYDGAGGLVVLFGGTGGSDLNDTWTYDAGSGNWTRKSPVSSPGPRLARMVYDGLGGETVVVGGCAGDISQVFNETWAYNVSNDRWTQRNPLPWAWGRARQGLAADSASGVVMLFGGGYHGYHGDTWTYSLKRYTPSGQYDSKPFDSGGAAYFGSIEWNASVPEKTSLRFQLRTAYSEGDLKYFEFMGPDGSAASYYTRSGERVFSGHNGTQWLQYRVYLCTTASANTPVLETVRLRYNLLQDVYISFPANDENLTGVRNITWEASDPDGDELSFDLYLVNENLSSGFPLVQNLTGATGFEWDTTLVPSGGYYLHLRANDNDTEIPLTSNYTSPLFHVFNPFYNHLPSVALLAPVDGATVNNTTVKLEWSGEDLDGDNLTYFVFLVGEQFNPARAPPPVAITTNTSYIASGLKKGAIYYWAVLANDGKANGTIAQIRSFRVPANRPPGAELLDPPDGTVVNSSSVPLAWKGSDEDLDSLTYRVIVSPVPFDASSAPAPRLSTGNLSCTVPDLLNGMAYYWTVVPFDGETNGTGTPVWRFTVSVVAPPDAPRVLGWGPKGAGVALKPSITVTFDREMNASSLLEALVLDPPAVETARFATPFTVSVGAELAPSTTYTVLVRTRAMSSNGNRLASPFSWNFTTLVTGEADSSLPVVEFTEPAGGAVLVGARDNITIVFSEAMDRNATGKAVSFSPPVNAAPSWLDQMGFALRFSPSGPMPGGTIRVSISTAARDEGGNPLDGNRNGRADGGADNYTFNFTVGIPPDWMPGLISRHPEGGGVQATSVIQLSFDRKMNQSSVEAAFSILPAVQGRWKSDADGMVFTFTPTGKLGAGTRYTVTVLASAHDAAGYPMQNDESWTFTTVGAATQKTELPWMIILVAVIIAVAGAGAIFWKMKKRSPEPQAVDEISAVEPPAPPIPPPEPFTVQDLFMMHRDGRPIMHAGRDAATAVELGEQGSVPVGIRDFAKQLKEDGAGQASMVHEGRKVLFEKGKWVVLSAVIGGPEADCFRDEMVSAVKNFEAEVGAAFPEWDGNAGPLAPAGRLLAPLRAFVPAAMEVRAATGADKVAFKTGVDFHHGYIKLNVEVENRLPDAITGASFKLMYSRDDLRLDRIEPDYESKGDELVIGTILPGEKKAISFHLDPQICTETYLAGILTFKTGAGNLETRMMPRKLVSVVCPILYTDENINTAMLRRMADEELAQKDVKVFNLPSSITPEKAFEVARSAVQHHDVKLVRVLEEKEPFAGEAWYYGKARGREDRLIIRARVLADRKVLEFFVASSSTLMITGMLAELKNDLNKELAARRGLSKMAQVTAPEKVDAVAMVRTLLDKATEAEIGAGETETPKKV